MLPLHLGRYAFALTAGVAVLAGCGESQTQSGPPLSTRDGASAGAVHTGTRLARGLEWNYTVRVLSSYETATIVAYCTGKDVATGGGWSLESVNSGHPYVWQDHPGNQFNNWSVTIENDSATKATIRVYVGCLPSSSSR